VLLTLLAVAVALVAALAVVIAVQGGRFERRMLAEAAELLRSAGPGARAPAAPESLPPPVRRYLELSGATRHRPVRTARLEHGGWIATAPERPLPLLGRQWFTADPPGFVWRARAAVAPGLAMDARDRSVGGEGRMLVMLASTITVADASGPALDDSALQRLAAELAWFPTALLDARYVTWEPLDDRSARARLRVGGREAEVVFHFGDDGFPARIAAQRYRDLGAGKAVRTPWEGRCADFREVDGLRVPFRMDASWLIDGKEFHYAHFEVTRLELDPVAPP
jgi:hypothetical protein